MPKSTTTRSLIPLVRPADKRPRESFSGEETAEIRQLVVTLSRWMDTAFEVPLLGWRFGFDALLGLIPGLGDAATTLVSLYIMALASRCGIPRITVARMGLNVAIDMLLGSLPLVGDLFDVWWKANQRNAALLHERLAQPAAASRRATAADWVFVGAMFAGLLVLFGALLGLTVLAVGTLWNALTGLLGG